ncbi:MAG: hypothetical protein CMD26_05535 [Flavobacteriales bacterium]|nr:hypothetical protein [Flavobacteriales bacterium]|tara:strand:- start:8842 stop:9204 length:363 start_codon:yes stop_codon:yes gene_type:complete
MNVSKFNLINSLTLILVPLWAYFTFEATPEKETLSLTAMIPLFLGVILLLCNNGLKRENKFIAHIAVLVTFIALLGLFMPLNAAISEGRMLSIIRVSIMILTSVLAMISFINSFIKARKT